MTAVIQKGYTDGPFGQIHWRMLEQDGDTNRPDLYCLHPAPYSGLAYTLHQALKLFVLQSVELVARHICIALHKRVSHGILVEQPLCR